jgi:RNA polymerase sigma-70 factor, ECF subfamily
MIDRPLHPKEPVSAASRALSDEALAARAQSGCLNAFVELHARFEVRVFNFLLRRIPRRSDAEDLTQETFLRSWQRVHTYQPAMRFSTWLFTIAVRLSIDHHRKTMTAEVVKQELRLNTSAESPPPDGADDQEVRDRGGNLWSLAHRVLTTDQHTALWLRYAEDLNMQDIATVMDRNPVAVRVMLFRARELLAKRAGEGTGSDQRHQFRSLLVGAGAGIGPKTVMRGVQ